MTSITDKFGKASISTNYAVATTVKTTRTAGVTVLEAFDLSKFAPDTPVFFVTYKKTTDPATNITSVTDLVSWKAIVNTGANTLTNLTLAPGYVDGGNAVGDFIECIPTSAWENDLIDGLLVSHNQDGTLKASALIAAIYPVGSIYINATDATNPATLLGFGTWAAFGAGRVMVGKNTSGTFQTIGATGGEETHVLTTAEMPSHTHNMYFGSGSEYIVSNPSPTGTHTGAGYGGYMAPAGGDGAHNNLQPYIVVYMWRRTA